MLDITHREIDATHLEVGDKQLALRGVETSVELRLGRGAWTWTYRRPTRVATTSDSSTDVVIRDYVMLARLAVAVISIALLMKRG